MSTSSNPKISIRGLFKRFGNNQVLQGVDLDVDRCESLVLIGTSGSGKSLLLKCMLGLQEPDAGNIVVDGVETTRLSERERLRFIDRFGVLFQYSGLFDSLPVWENVAFKAVQQRGYGRAKARDTAVEAIQTVGLSADVADLYPQELSGGMQKRVGIARAIFGEPEFLFLDEPTAGLDPIMTNVIGTLITACVRKLGATAVSITSDMTGAKRIADRVAMLHDGRIIWTGTPDQAERSGNAYVDQLFHARAQGPIEMRVAVG